MTTAFQITLLLVILLSFLGTWSSTFDKKMKENLTFTCAISMALMFASLVWL